MAKLIKVVGVSDEMKRYCIIFLGHQINSMEMISGFISVDEAETFAKKSGVKKYVIVEVNSKEEQDKLDLSQYKDMLTEKFYKVLK